MPDKNVAPADWLDSKTAEVAIRPLNVGSRRRWFEFFNSGPGYVLAAPLVDAHFQYWKLRHGVASFGEYYARSIAASLKQGGSHKTLGGTAFLRESPFSRRARPREARFGGSGRRYFEAAVRAGLKPFHVCVDYGCGSLRVGRHLIDYLEPNRYWGLDIVSDFYEAGLPLLPPGLAADKRPRFRRIGAEAARELAVTAPDFILSFAVMKHVPPRELARYFAGIATLMAPGAQALITYTNGPRSRRAGAKIWTHEASAIAAALQAAGDGLGHAIRPIDKPGAGGCSILTVWRAPAEDKAIAVSSPAHCALTATSWRAAHLGIAATEGDAS